MNCLITGTRGYIGQTLSRHLAECGYKVFEIGGRSDFPKIGTILGSGESFDLVIHAGCTTEFVNQYQSAAESPNCQNTEALVSSLNQLTPRPYLIVTGAAGIFGVSPDKTELDESSTGSKSSWFRPYDQTQYIHDKKSQIEILRSYQGKSCTLCFTTVFGKGMSNSTLNFYRNMKKKFIFPVPFGGTSFLGEKDMLSAIDVCLKKRPQGTFIISSGNISFKELFLTAKRAMNSKNPRLIFRIPYPFLFCFILAQKILPRFNVLISTFGNKFYSSKKFQAETDWKPSERIEQLFREIL